MDKTNRNYRDGLADAVRGSEKNRSGPLCNRKNYDRIKLINRYKNNEFIAILSNSSVATDRNGECHDANVR